MKTLHALFCAAAMLSVAPPARAADEKAAAPKPATAGKTMLRLEVKPASEIFVDGKSRGKTELLELEVKAGLHIVRFVHASGDEHENQLDAVAKKTTTYQWKFDYEAAPVAGDKPAEPTLVTP